MKKEYMHQPAEIFGFPPSNKTNLAKIHRKQYLCPFIERKCTKQTRLLNYPLGICSAWHKGAPRIICPQRFYYDGYQLLKFISKDFLGDNFSLVSEVKLDRFGNVDWVSFVVSEKGDIDFIGIEIMADSTTQTGKLVEALQDFMESNRLKDTYNYGMNTYNTIKLSFTQMLNKGQVFEHWGKYYIWIAQKELFQILMNKFGLKMDKGVKNGKIIFASTSMKFDNNKDIFSLCFEEYYSASVQKLLQAYKREYVPKMSEFVEAILRKAGLKDTKTRKLTDFTQ